MKKKMKKSEWEYVKVRRLPSGQIEKRIYTEKGKLIKIETPAGYKPIKIEPKKAKKEKGIW